MDNKIVLQPLIHRGQESIALVCEKKGPLNTTIRRLPKAKWSQSNRCWYVPLNQESYSLAVKNLKGVAAIDSSALKAYLQKRKQAKARQLP